MAVTALIGSPCHSVILSANCNHGFISGGARQWKMVSLLVAMPAIGLGMFNAFAGGDHHDRPEFVAYEHLRLRTKVIFLILMQLCM